MSDSVHKWTDSELVKMEKKISRIYKQAENELNKKYGDFLDKACKKIGDLYNEYINADAVSMAEKKAAYEKALDSAVFKNQNYKEMIQSVTKDIANINKQALAYTNGQLPNIYAQNYQQIGNVLDKMDVSYHLVDQNTIKRLITDGSIKLPTKKLNVSKDMAWNARKIQSSILQGILQGESINDISKRLLPIMNNNRSAAIRNARTLVTGAENRGRLDSYKELNKQGFIVKKAWISTEDNRTREWHLEMDGQEVDIDEPFIDGLGNELDYPADPSAPPETIYNCRCSMRAHIVGLADKEGEITDIDFDKELSEQEQEKLNEWNEQQEEEELYDWEKEWLETKEEAYIGKEEEEEDIDLNDIEKKEPVFANEEEVDDFMTNLLKESGYTDEQVEQLMKEEEESEEIISEFDADEWKRELLERSEDETELFDEWCDKWCDTLTSDEQYGVEAYTGSAYMDMNMFLNGLKDSTRYEKEIEDCYNALSKASYPETQIVRRGSSERTLNLLFGNSPETLEKIRNRDFDDMKGSLITSPSFLSTSPFGAGGFTDMQVEYYIKIPEGAQAMYVDPISRNSGELETLINKDVSIYVHDIQFNPKGSWNGVTEVFLEVLK